MYLKQFIILIILISIYRKTNGYIQDNLSKSVKYDRNSDYRDRNKKTSQQENDATLASLADLYYFYPNDLKGIFNCSYKDTVNITGKSLSSNGSYSYDKYTFIPPNLVGDYDYEILYNGSKRLVKQHKRACICHLKPCISFCSKHIPETYNYVVLKGMKSALEMFSVDITLKNKSTVTKNIGKDFVPIVLNEYCEMSYFLSPEVDPQSSWTLFENGDLQINSDKTLQRRNEYCFDFHQIKINGEMYDLINPRICAKKKEALGPLEKYKYYIQVLSVIFLLLTIIVYCCIPELLNVHGKCLVSYAGCLAMSFSIFSFINLSEINFTIGPCLIMGYLNLFLQLAHFTWLGIICFDIWKSFSDLNYHGLYRRYAKYGFFIPFAIVLFAFVMQNFDIYEFLQPGITLGRCGLDVLKWSAVIYLYGPCLFILLFCFKCFIEMFQIIKNNDEELKETEVMVRSDSPKKRYIFYLRLFIIMGISWNLDLLSYLFQMINCKILSSIIDYINSLQGLYIFINFILRKKICKLLRHRFQKRIKK